MTQWPHRYIIVVEAQHAAYARAAAVRFAGRYGERADRTFDAGAHLSADGKEPATHFACNTAATDDMRRDILSERNQLTASRGQSSVRVFDVHNDGWTFEKVLTEMGLQRIEPPEETEARR